MGERLVAVVAVIVLTATFFSQHPNRAFDRFRSVDKIGFMLPNWRFFAPEPAQTDFHILHRTLSSDGIESPWQDTHVISPRKLLHFVWFPDRRTDKAVFDVVSEILGIVPSGQQAVVSSPAYRLLVRFVRSRIDTLTHPALDGYQVMIASSQGFDESSDPEEVFVSPFIPWKDQK
ncbi:hypothetical protein [Microbacterium lacticum]